MLKLKVFIELLLLITSAFGIFTFNAPQELKPLPSLPAVESRELSYSGVLDLRREDTKILGATVDVNPRDVIKAANRRRIKYGIAPLKTNQTLMKTAQMRAEVIVRHKNFSHGDPYEGITLDTILPGMGYYYFFAAENIGMGGVSGEDFIAGFFNSPSHKAAILNPEFVETGVGIARGNFDGWDTLVVVQHFAVPSTKRDWYGWNKSDISYYNNLLSQIQINLDNTNKWLKQSNGRDLYYQGWQKLLKRQKKIIAHLLNRMIKGERFTNHDRQLIAEYNANWGKAPSR